MHLIIVDQFLQHLFHRLAHHTQFCSLSFNVFELKDLVCFMKNSQDSLALLLAAHALLDHGSNVALASTALTGVAVEFSVHGRECLKGARAT